MQKETWIVVANKEKARIFEVEKFGSLKEIHTLIHPQSGLKADELYSDNMGCTTEAFRMGQHMMEPATTYKVKEAIIFARQISKYLDAEKKTGRFTRMFLMAEPSFLGVLRNELSAGVTKCVEAEVSKDLTKFTAGEIWTHMPVVN